MKLKKRFAWRPMRLVVIFVLLLCGSASAQQPHTLTGDIRVHKQLHSKFLPTDRNVIVYLPPHYESAKRTRYPVLYLHDGQNLFDGATSFIGGQEWRVDETVESMISSGKIEPLIIVGVYNAGRERINEYTPTEDAKYKQGGQADLYGRLLVEELKPFIDRTYRTRRGAKDTGIGGSSLGGIVSIYLALRYPHVFGKAAVVSPSVWFANQHILGFVNSLPRQPVRIWLDIGTNEGGDPQDAQQTVKGAQLLYEALVRKGWKPGRDLSYFEAKDAAHNEAAWAARVEPILKFLFPRRM